MTVATPSPPRSRTRWGQPVSSHAAVVGLPPAPLLAMLAEVSRGREGRQLRRLVEEVLENRSLREAMTRVTLSPRLRRLLETGLEHDVVSPLLAAELTLADGRSRAGSRLRHVLVYPVLMMIASLALLWAQQHIIGSAGIDLREMGETFGVEMGTPLFTETSKRAAAIAPPLLLGLSAVLLWTFLAPFSPGLRQVHQRLVSLVPGLSGAVRQRAQAEVAEFAGRLVGAGLPLQTALVKAGELAVPLGGRRLGRRLAAGIKRGHGLEETLTAAGLESWARDLPSQSAVQSAVQPAGRSPHVVPTTSAVGSSASRELGEHLRRCSLASIALAIASVDLFLAWLLPLLVLGTLAIVALAAVSFIAPVFSMIKLLNMLS